MTDYVDRPEEGAKNPHAKEWLRRVANGNAAAFEFCWAMWNFEHMLDDLVDEPHGTVSQAWVAREMARVFTTLSFNEFYLINKAELFSLLISCFNRWVEADEMRAMNESEDLTSAVRCAELDLFSFVAFLTGGWDHMRAMRDMRTFDPGDA
jgi:hypothetical protein